VPPLHSAPTVFTGLTAYLPIELQRSGSLRICTSREMCFRRMPGSSAKSCKKPPRQTENTKKQSPGGRYVQTRPK